MEIEQIGKQVEWLDEERRKDKLKIGELEQRLRALEEQYQHAALRLKGAEDEVARLNALQARLDALEEGLSQSRVAMQEAFETWEKQERKRQREWEKVRREEMTGFEAVLAEMRKEVEQLPEMRRSLKARADEEVRLTRLVEELRAHVEALRRSNEETVRALRQAEDGRRQDTKRLTDLAGESNAMRKRLEEQGGRLESAMALLKKLEGRVNEMFTLEAERRQMMTNFVDSLTFKDAERDRVWKEWQARFEVLERQSADLEKMLQEMDETHRTVKRSQQQIDELNQKVERRVAEITELQRLSEERFRQEWVTFKADDQKRWTNYTLTMEEQRQEIQRQQERLADRVVHLEDTLQEVQDILQLMSEQSERQLQGLLAMLHEWTTTFERTIGRYNR